MILHNSTTEVYLENIHLKDVCMIINDTFGYKYNNPNNKIKLFHF